MNDDLWNMVPVTPPFAAANEILKPCEDCHGFHEASDMIEVILAHIAQLQALPFACDRDILERVVNASCTQEIIVGYKHLLRRRTSIPTWFLEVMDLDLLVSAWGHILTHLVHPDTGEFLGLTGEFGDYDAWDSSPLYHNDTWLSPLEIWDAGPVSVGVWFPLQLFHVSPGETHRLEVGWIGGKQCEYLLHKPEVHPYPPVNGDFLMTGPPIQAAIDSTEEVPILARISVQKLEDRGLEWELAWVARE